MRKAQEDAAARRTPSEKKRSCLLAMEIQLRHNSGGKNKSGEERRGVTASYEISLPKGRSINDVRTEGEEVEGILLSNLGLKNV